MERSRYNWFKGRKADDFPMEIGGPHRDTGGSRNLLFVLRQGFSVAKKRIAALESFTVVSVWFPLRRILHEPYFAYYVDTSPTHIQTIDDARLAIQRSNETIEKMANDLRESF